jgi:hypothetical protein
LPAEPAQLEELRYDGRYEEATPGAPKDHPPVDSAPRDKRQSVEQIAAFAKMAVQQNEGAFVHSG